MAVSSCSLSLAPGFLTNKLNVVPQPLSRSSFSTAWKSDAVACSKEMIMPSDEVGTGSCLGKERFESLCFDTDLEILVSECCPRRSLLTGLATLAVGLLPASTVLAEEVPANYKAFVDKADGYSYYYPSDWREFDFRAHDSAFKDRYLQLQNVRLSFIPTDKTDVHDLGPMEEVIPDLVMNIYAAPNQTATIYGMEERTTEGKNYYTVEYVLTSPNFARTAFATIAIGNGRYYTLIVGANDRRWRRVRNQLKVVADSFKVLDI